MLNALTEPNEILSVDYVATPGFKPTIVRPNEGKVLQAFGDLLQVKLSPEHTGGQFSLFLDTTPAQTGPPSHFHLMEDELFIVLEGKISFLLDGVWSELTPGSVVFVPRGVIHTFRNTGDRPSRQWVLTTPSGFERFFSRCAEVFSGKELPDITRIREISAEHGIYYVEEGREVK